MKGQSGHSIGAANRQSVLDFLTAFPGITNREISKALELSEMAVGRHVAAIRAAWLKTFDPRRAAPGINERSIMDNTAERPLTFGEKAVGLTFNPSGDEAVAKCKRIFADAIDQMHVLRLNTADPEVGRMCSLAITEAQTAQMWAVKALTWRG